MSLAHPSGMSADMHYNSCSQYPLGFPAAVVSPLNVSALPLHSCGGVFCLHLQMAAIS
jgi:hypothetical protein